MQPSTIASSGVHSSSGRRGRRWLRGAAAGGSGSLLLPIVLLLLTASGVISPTAVEAGPLGSSSEEIRTGSGNGHVLGHTLSKRSFFDIQCKGVYDKSIFARLDRICEDCYNLFREPQLHSLCRSHCFSSPYFKGCLQALYLHDEEDQYNQMVDFMGK